MSQPAANLLTPRILVVDDERQIYASLRLRLGKDYDLAYCADAREALKWVAREPYDLCFADIHMPHMTGLSFIEAAQKFDPALGYVILTAFDTDENLRRAIPLQVFAFLPKPLPERHEFEACLPDWVGRTRQRRRDLALARRAGAIEIDLESARLARDVELVASETARDALQQVASLLTTIHAHLVAATTALGARAKIEPSIAQLARGLEEAKRTADAAVAVSAEFFDSAYGSRDSSLALIDSGLTHAAGIAMRMCRAEANNKLVDTMPVRVSLPIRDLTGIDFLLMMVPAIAIALTLTPSNTTVRIATEALPRLDAVIKDPRHQHFLFLNRRHALGSQPGVLITVSANVPALPRDRARAWLRGEDQEFAGVVARGLVLGVQKSHGILALASDPPAATFCLFLALPL